MANYTLKNDGLFNPTLGQIRLSIFTYKFELKLYLTQSYIEQPIMFRKFLSIYINAFLYLLNFIQKYQ